MGGKTYGPKRMPGSLVNFSAYQVPQENQTLSGDGSEENPYTITTRATTGEAGIAIEQVDSYIKHTELLTTTLKIRNDGTTKRDITAFRAADCFLSGDDKGAGKNGDGWAACVNEKTGALLQFKDNPISHVQASAEEGPWDKLWETVGAGESLKNTSVQKVHDNALGLSWRTTLEPGTEVELVAETVFNANVVKQDDPAYDSDNDGLPDAWERNGVPYGDSRFPLQKWAKVGQRDVMLTVGWVGRPNPACDSVAKALTNPGCATGDSSAPTVKEFEQLINYFKEIGIALHIDAGKEMDALLPEGSRFGEYAEGGQRLPYRGYFVDDADLDGKCHKRNWSGAFCESRSVFASGARDKVFRVMTLVPEYMKKNGSSGLATIGGADLFVMSKLTPEKRFRTMVHEMGHNFQIRHGGPVYPQNPPKGWEEGGAKQNCKMAYNSVVNYLYQLNGTALFSEKGANGVGDWSVTPDEGKCAREVGSPSSGKYHYFSDLDYMQLVSSKLGETSLGALKDPEHDSELSLEEMYNLGLVDMPGTVDIDFEGPGYIIGTADDETLKIAVRNSGKEEDTFAVKVASGSYLSEQEVTLAGYEKRVLEFAVPRKAIDAGNASVKVTVTGTNGKITEKEGNYSVLEPTEEEARDAVERLIREGASDEASRSLLGKLLKVSNDVIPVTETVVTTAPPVTVTNIPAPTTITQPAETVRETATVVQTVSPTPTTETTTEEPSESGSTESNDTVIAVVVSVLVTTFALLGGIGFAAYNNLIPGVDATKLFGR